MRRWQQARSVRALWYILVSVMRSGITLYLGSLYCMPGAALPLVHHAVVREPSRACHTRVSATRRQPPLPSAQAAVSALMNVRTLFRGDLYTIAALDGHTRDHLEVDHGQALLHVLKHCYTSIHKPRCLVVTQHGRPRSLHNLCHAASAGPSTPTWLSCSASSASHGYNRLSYLPREGGSQYGRFCSQELIAEQTDDGAGCVMCLGHNKGWEEAASSFAVILSAVGSTLLDNSPLPVCQLLPDIFSQYAG